uniref:Uncharacterized protein n=1 Tax=Aedes albopictus TaxID=7160 RepID=A0A023EI01_AEDAL
MVLRNGNDLDAIDDISEDEGGGHQRRRSNSPDGNGFQHAMRIERNQQELEDMIRNFVDGFTFYWNLFVDMMNDLIRRYRVREIAIETYEALRNHPLLALSIAAAICCLSLPFVIFVFFTLCTAIMTFTGFVLIEGTLITMASMLLVGVLIGLGCLFGTFGMAVLVGYLGVSKVYGWIGQRR